MNDVLVILGNGYDVAQNYPTRYIDFYNNSKSLKCLAKKGNKLCKHILNNYKSSMQWSDLEAGLYEYSKELTRLYGEGNAIVANDFMNEFNELRQSLFEYLADVSNTPQVVDSYSHVMGLSVEWMNAKPQYFTFNYSEISLSMAVGKDHSFIIPNIGINPDRFIYQHGAIKDFKTFHQNNSESVVLGIDDKVQKVEQLHSFLYKTNQNVYNLHESIGKIRNAELYIIYGCSMGDSDMMYFKEILNQKNKIYIIYYYDEDAYKSLKGNICRITGSLSTFMNDNEVVFLPLKDVDETRNKTKEIISKYVKS